MRRLPALARSSAESLWASSLGRRLLAALALATLVPVAALAVLADRQVSRSLRDARDAELAQQAKSYALAAFDRLLQVETALREAATDAASGVPLAMNRIAGSVSAGHGELAGLARIDADGRLLDSLGELPDALPVAARFDLSNRNELAAGRSLLLPPAVPDGPPLLMLQLDASMPRTDAPRFLLAAVGPGFLWGDPDLNPVMTDFCVLVGKQRAHCPAAVPAELPLEEVQDGRRSGLTWHAGGESQRAGGWTLFVRSRLAGPDWIVFAVQPEAYATAPTRAFRAAFIPIAVASLLVVLMLAARQVRQISTPIQELLRGTQRLAARDFSTQVAVGRDDEFGRLASAFNTMAARLALQFGTLQAMAKIDRAILNSVDLSEVALNSIRCLRHIVDTDLISIGLLHPESPTRLLVQTRRRGARGIEKLELEWSGGAVTADGQAPALPADYARHLGARPDEALRVLPISRGGAFWGVIVLGDPSGQAGGADIDPDRASLLTGVVDRLAVALSTAARDWRLHVQAHYDPLTGLPNRVHLLTLLTQHIAQSRRDSSRGAVLFLDLDRFKQTNDTLGHAAGDMLLRLAAERIRLSLRESDTVARIGGDEFTVVLSRIASSRDAGQVAANLIAALSRPFELDGQKIYAGGSVGIALFPEDGITPEELLKRADTAMYRAKELGRGRHAFFKESMGVEVSARAALDRELRQALERNEFVLHYQPQIDVRTGEITSVEALLRWQHPQRGLLPPGEFIEFAEESGLIESIGAWVLRAACEQHRLWELQGIDVPRVSVNVSNRQLKQPGFVAAVDVALMKAQRSPDQLEVEITESLVIDGGEVAMRTLNGLQQAGVRVAIDDFGTGYSSFAYLRTIPASILKLDRSFVVDMASDPHADVIAASIITMALTLGKTVVVEGVETEEQLSLLANHGAHRIQGYLVSRPLAAAVFEDFVRDYVPARYARERSIHLVKPAADAA
jgi:diguanylate cyclase (GGDEF)-like protein